MKIEINIIGLSDLAKSITTLAEAIGSQPVASISAGTVATIAPQEKAEEPEPEKEEPKPKKKAGKKKAAKAEKEEPKPEPEPEPKKEEPAADIVSMDDVVALGKEYVAKHSPTELRALLDKEIEGETISKCDPSKYPALKKLISKALAD